MTFCVSQRDILTEGVGECKTLGGVMFTVGPAGRGERHVRQHCAVVWSDDVPIEFTLETE